MRNQVASPPPPDSSIHSVSLSGNTEDGIARNIAREGAEDLHVIIGAALNLGERRL